MENIDWKNVERQIVKYGSHIRPRVIDGFFKREFAEKLVEEFPSFDSDVWLRYDNPIEIKKVCNNWNVFPRNTYSIFSYFNSAKWLDYISKKLFEGNQLYADSGLNGGGWHIHKKGGKLNTHLDYSLHQISSAKKTKYNHLPES